MLFHDIFQLLWSIVSLSVILAILWFIVRRIIKGGANNKNRELLFVIALGACLQGCSSFEEKRLDPVPVPIVKSHDDVDLGEVVVIGRREILLPIANYVGLDETGFGSDYSIRPLS